MKTLVWIGIPDRDVLCEGAYASECVAQMRTEPDRVLEVGRNNITAIRVNGSVVGIGHPVDLELAPALGDRGLRGTAISIIADALASIGVRGPVKVCIHAEA
jgi:hypothetical protein